MDESFLDEFAQQNHAPEYHSDNLPEIGDGDENGNGDGEDGARADDHQAAREGNPLHDNLEKTSGPGRPKANNSSALTDEQRKERQRNQNRKAAERSRNRKRHELTTLEMTVNNIQEENQQLRNRLATLLADKSKPKRTTIPASRILTNDNASLPHQILDTPAGIDFTNLAKLQSELSAAKQALMEKEFQLAQMRDGQSLSSLDQRRQTLLSNQTALVTLQTEIKALHALLGHLRTEKDTLIRQREILEKEIDGRKALAQAANEIDVSEGKSAGAERALLDLRNWLDGAIKTWDQTSLLPVPDQEL